MKSFKTLLIVVLSAFVSLCWSSPLAAQQADGKLNLDLPYDAYGSSEEEEEAPEVVFFYGQQYEGDGFFFCLDRSSSTAGGELEIEKREAIRAITQFSKRVQFAVVFYDQGLLKWPNSGQPAEANAGRKASAIAWISTMTTGRGTCVREGLLQALQFANRSSAQRNVVIYEGDGGTHCPGHNAAQYGQQALAGVAGANFKRHQINSICVGPDSQGAQDWCRTLAAMNNGTFKLITR